MNKIQFALFSILGAYIGSLFSLVLTNSISKSIIFWHVFLGILFTILLSLFLDYISKKNEVSTKNFAFVKGDKISSITTIDKFRRIMGDLIKGYPAYLYFGIFEFYFGDSAQKVIEFLKDDGILKVIPAKDNEPVKYRLTSNGIILATAMAQMEYSEKMKNMTLVLIFLGGLAFILNLNYFFFF